MKEQLELTNAEDGEPLSIKVNEVFESPFTGSFVYFGDFGKDHVAVKFSKYNNWGPQREWQGLNMTYNHGIPVPKPYFFVNNGSRQGVVSEFIGGGDLFDNPSQYLKKELGRVVRQMHDTVPVVGKEFEQYGVRDFSMYQRYMDGFTSSTLEMISEQSDSYALIHNFSEAAREANDSIKPAFIHNDIHNEQALLKEGKLHLFDFEMWRERHPLDDVSMYLFHTLRMDRPEDDFIAFSEGYLDGHNFTDNQKSIIAFYLLFTSMRSVEFYARFRPHELEVSIDNLNKATRYIEQERLWV